MNESDTEDRLWEQIDDCLSRSEVLEAFRLYREATDCSVVTGKGIIGQRYREQFPNLWAAHRNLIDEN